MKKQRGYGYMSDLYEGVDDYLKRSRALSKMATGIGAVGTNAILSRILGPGLLTAGGTVAGGSLLAYPIYQAGYGKQKPTKRKKPRKRKK